MGRIFHISEAPRGERCVDEEEALEWLADYGTWDSVPEVTLVENERELAEHFVCIDANYEVQQLFLGIVARAAENPFQYGLFEIDRDKGESLNIAARADLDAVVQALSQALAKTFAGVAYTQGFTSLSAKEEDDE